MNKMKSRKKIIVLLPILLVVIVGVLLAAFIIARGSMPSGNEICDGVYIDEVDVSGMTEEEAKEAVDEYVRKLGERTLTVSVRGSEETITFGELGFACKDNSYIEDALKIGTEENLIKRYKKVKDVEKNQQLYELSFVFDEDLVRNFVEERLSLHNKKVKNSQLKYVDGVFTATPSRKGKTVDVEKTVENIMNVLAESDDEDNVYAEAVIQTEEPEHSQKMVALCKDQLATFSTTYSSSTEERAANVGNAANYINGTILYPGDVFSTNEVIKDRTVENGYKVASEYSSGKVVDGIGGGVCQVATTLYNTVLRAELEIVERSPHSMVVSYVDVSMDAAIAGDYKDFKFKNNTDAPVYIAASAVNRVLTFTIYGYETRASNRTISFASEIKETIQPGEDVITYDDSLPSTYSHVDQSAHVGYKAELWKIIYEYGVEKERVQVNTSSYSAEPAYITKGKQEEEPEEKEDTGKKSNKANKKPESSSNSGTPDKKPSNNNTENNAPAATPEPADTAEDDVVEEETETLG